MGGKNTPPGTFEQIYEPVKHYDVEVVNKGFQTGGYAVLKTTKLEHAWWLFDWLKIIGIYTGKKTGPCKAWRVSVSVSSVWFLVRVRYCKVTSCSWVLTIQESAGAIVVVQRPQHCAYDQAALEQLAEQLRQSLGITPDEIPPSTPAPGTSSVPTLRPVEPACPPRRADAGVADVDEDAALQAALLSPQDRTIHSMSMSFLMISVLDRSYLKRSALEIPQTMTGDQFLCCPSSFDLTFFFLF